MFLQLKKLIARINELERYRFKENLHIHEFRMLEEPIGQPFRTPPASEHSGWKTRTTGSRWKGRDRYAWIYTEIEVPEAWHTGRVTGRFDFGANFGGNLGGFESLLYVDGAPYQGVDIHHKEVLFPMDCKGKSFRLHFRLWSGHEFGGPQTEQEHVFKQFELSLMDVPTDQLCTRGKAVLETLNVLNEHRYEYQELLKVLDRAFSRLDWSEPGSDRFYQSTAEALDVLNLALSSMKTEHPVTVTCVGHTHIDVAWMWRLQHTREKAERSFTTVLRLMEEYPEYKFLQTMPQIYEYIKEDSPELYAQIKEKVKEGRWEAGGAMWLEADCNLPSGESLVRQILYGTAFFREEFGQACKYLWLPDVFGYSWALPQILSGCGIPVMMTTKISWNQYNRMPHDTFRWRGMDGSEVLVHFITTPEPDAKSDTWFYTYNGDVRASTVTGIWNSYKDKEMNNQLLLAYGYGDGGGGVNRNMLEMRRALSEMPGLPEIVTGTADEYFSGLKKRVDTYDGYVHVWDGELYLEYHRGTYTSQAKVKRWNRQIEIALRRAEWLGVMNSLVKGEPSHYDKARFDLAWKIVLRNQFHDIIPGSSIAEVYADAELEYEEAFGLVHSIQEEAVTSLLESNENNSAVYTIWNSSNQIRADYVVIPYSYSDDLYREQSESVRWTQHGKQLDVQPTEEGWLVYVPGIPSLGYTTLESTINDSEELLTKFEAFELTKDGLITPFYKLSWNASGQITRLWDRTAERDVLAVGSKGNVFQVFEDKPLNFDAWDIDIFSLEHGREVTNATCIEVLEAGPLRVTVKLEWTYGKSVIRQNMMLYRESRRIDFRTIVDWHEKQQLLKVAFPVQIRATEATYDIQFGNVRRPTHWNTSWDYARFETCGHQWADVSERGYGVSLLNDCKYGYDIKDSVMRLSLIKSSVWPDPNADQGEHAFTYSLYPHEGDWADGNTQTAAWFLNEPVTVTQGGMAAEELSLFTLSADCVWVDTVKQTEAGTDVIVRLHEYKGSSANLQLIPAFPYRHWRFTNLLEENCGPVHEHEIRFDIKPYEIKTIKITFGS
ncbi:alpha-mannosidase [Paenibacillus swuensis]|uniref:Alpha-mannosidase n=1 Tax=Paenibacillus swuensis TaxID=1178515 RepID=A0A172TQD5_9BACL|nr:alpha-mannosidase [Paenibacillus swuensis]ANE49104.1 alpha-mannosidase [Paenibacillus swuensis]